MKKTADRRFYGKSTKNKQSKEKPREYDDYEHERRLELIRGRRLRKRIKRISVSLAILLIILAIIITNILLPTGIIEYIQNDYAVSGKGSLPVNIYSQNCSCFKVSDKAICLINDYYFETYNENGKLVRAVSHGMKNPVLETSEARFLLYDRDRYSLNIYNYSSELYSTEYETVIYAADISRCGAYAVATSSVEYAAVVIAYNEDNEQIFSWNSANDYVTDVAVSDDGKRVAVATLNASGGVYVSNVYLFEVKGGRNYQSVKIDGLISSLSSTEEYLLASGIDTASIIPWDGKAKTDIETAGNIRCFDSDYDGNTVLVFSQTNNQNDNDVVFINSDGQITGNVEIKSYVTDISVSGGYATVLYGNTVAVYSLERTLCDEVELPQSGIFAGLTYGKKAAVIYNSQMDIYDTELK